MSSLKKKFSQLKPGGGGNSSKASSRKSSRSSLHEDAIKESAKEKAKAMAAESGDKPVGLTLRDLAQKLMGKPSKQEHESEAHQLFRSYPGHNVAPAGTAAAAARKSMGQQRRDTEHSIQQAQLDEQEALGIAQHDEPCPGIASPGATGVLFVTDRAFANGFTYDNEEWANFGQGAPEVGEIPGCAPRPTSIPIENENVNEYAPTTGVKELRQAVADYYNREFRKGKESQYSYENVCVVPGGRAGLTRVAAVIGDVLVSYSLPEYTAYDQMLSVFKRLVPIPTSLDASDGYKLHLEQLQANISSMGLSCVVVSNPKNPTGQAIEGEELEQLVATARKDQVTMVLDEFYSWYDYEHTVGSAISAARYIEDVNKDPIILIDGLTKNWRLPGWRCCWVVGPAKLVAALSQSGSFLDGGASHPIQMAGIKMLEPERVKQDRAALQKHFKMKRDHVLKRLKDMGLEVKVPPKYTFYIWLDLSSLPPPLDSGLVFFEELLKEKCIVVPGLFFDINPMHRRNLMRSPCHHFVRLSFGPALKQLDKGLDAIERVLQMAKQELEETGTLERIGTRLAPHDHGEVAIQHGQPGHA